MLIEGHRLTCISGVGLYIEDLYGICWIGIPRRLKLKQWRRIKHHLFQKWIQDEEDRGKLGSPQKTLKIIVWCNAHKFVLTPPPPNSSVAEFCCTPHPHLILKILETAKDIGELFNRRSLPTEQSGSLVAVFPSHGCNQPQSHGSSFVHKPGQPPLAPVLWQLTSKLHKEEKLCHHRLNQLHGQDMLSTNFVQATKQSSSLYSKTSLCGHLCKADTSSLRTVFISPKHRPGLGHYQSCHQDASLIRTARPSPPSVRNREVTLR